MNNEQRITAIRRKAKEHGLVFRKSDEVQEGIFLWEFALRGGFNRPHGKGHLYTLADAFGYVHMFATDIFLQDLRDDLIRLNNGDKK